MSTPLILALASAPLACYFWVLAMWHGGRHPRLVTGRADFFLLATGVGGLLTFGPFGQFLVRRLFGEPGFYGWAALVSAAVLAALSWGRRAANRLVIYHIDPETLDAVLQDALDLKSGKVRRSLGGFEHRDGAYALSVEASRRFHYAVIEVRGAHPEPILSAVRPAIAARLRAITIGPSPMAWWLLILSALTMVATLVGYLVLQPRAGEAVRFLFERLRGH